MDHINWNAYAQVELETYCLNAFSINKEKAIEDFARSIERVTKNLRNPETCLERHKFFGIDGANPKDYEEQILNFDEGLEAIVGIRFFGLDVSKPFLSIRTNVFIDDEKELRAILKIASKKFAVFSPLYLQIFTPNPCKGFQATSTLVLGETSSVETTQTDVSLRKVEKDEEYFSWYNEQYKKFHQSRPDLKEDVTINSEDLMNESREAGLLYKAYKGPIQIGLIAGESAEFLGEKSLYMNEIVIGEEFKGKGYAKIMQRNFIYLLRSEFKFVFGTIHPKNTPSMKTALSNGRIPVRYESLIKI